MIDIESIIAHLKRTGRMKLLPRVLREVKENEQRERLTAPRTETAKENPALISGFRTIENGILTDRTGKRALLEIYQNVTK